MALVYIDPADGAVKDYRTNLPRLIFESLPKYSYVYGEYARKHVAYNGLQGFIYGEINVFCPVMTDATKFIENMRVLGYEFDYAQINTDGGSPDCNHEKYKVSFGGISIAYINLSYTRSGFVRHTPFEKEYLDADVNGLCMRGGNITHTLSSEVTIEKAQENIRASKYRAMLGMNENKKRLLEKEGYQEIKMDEDTKKTVRVNVPSSQLDFFKSIGEDIAVRVITKEMTTGVKQGMLMLLASQGQSSDKIKVVSDMMEGPGGDVFVSAILGGLLHFTPHVNQDPRVQKIARECFVAGGTIVGTNVVDVAKQYFMPMIQSSLDKLPSQQKKRVAGANADVTNFFEVPVEDVVDETKAEEEIPSAKKMTT